NSYSVGSLMHMGPGFFPLVLGALLVAVGVLIAGAAMTGGESRETILPERKEGWGWTCILAAALGVILLGGYGRMGPATSGCVRVAALGDRSGTWKSAVVLAFGVTVFGVALFSYLLQLPFPIFRGVSL